MGSNIVGTSGRAFLSALSAATSIQESSPSWRHPRLMAEPEELVEALRGQGTGHRRFLLELHRPQIDSLQRRAQREARLGEAVAPFDSKART